METGTINKGRRAELTRLKFRKRMWDHKISLDAEGNFYAFKSHGTPCSCWICRGEKYSRKVKSPEQLEENQPLEL